MSQVIRTLSGEYLPLHDESLEDYLRRMNVESVDNKGTLRDSGDDEICLVNGVRITALAIDAHFACGTGNVVEVAERFSHDT